MEQLTWPKGSNGRQPHPFSCVSTSYHGSQDRQSGSRFGNTSCIPKRHQRPSERCHLYRTPLVFGEHFNNDRSNGEEERAGQLATGDKEMDKHLNLEKSPLPCNNPNSLDCLSYRKSSREKHEHNLEWRCWTGQSNLKTKTSSSSSISSSLFRSICAQDKTDESVADFTSLPFDVLVRIAGSFSWPNLWSASRVCRSWNQGLSPLREAMLFVHWGKKFKHGRGVARDVDKALDSFVKGAVRGCAAAMVDAGLLLWELGRRQEGIRWYRQAAELGDPAGQCNLGLAYLQHPSDPTEAVKWFHRAALAGHVRAQYSLALCLQQGRGVEINPMKAARWYLKAAQGGNTRAMHNVALCYSKGEGMPRNRQEARRWMKRAALAGHHKAQYDYGLTLFSEGDGGLALVFLELATRAGETAATHLRDALLEELSPRIRAHAITCADKWQMKQNLGS